MQFNYLLAFIGLAGVALAVPAPDAQPDIMKRADEAQANAQNAQNGQNGQNGQWWGPGYWGHPWHPGPWHPYYGGWH
ncbi:hypothetical protein N7528_006211 [Penicillium herquei]|nr:hypothetical protein N7528_006211 [Penicillium herquei]